MNYNIRKLDSELNRNNNNNFIFELYNRNTFNEDKFHKFIGSIREFIGNYPALQHLPEEKYFYYMNEIIKNFEHIEGDLMQYYMYIREYSERLILNIQE